MGDPGPDYTLRRPVDIHQPLLVIFRQDDDDVGGYFIQEDGMAMKNRPQPTAATKAKREVPTPVVTLIDDESEARKFPPRPAHFMTCNRSDTEIGQSIEYDVDSDDEDVIACLNQCVPAKKGTRALTPEILESYFDFFDKSYFFSKQQSKLPVRQLLLRRRELSQKCLICDFGDSDQALLECHCCGIMVHSTCYHDLLYSTSLIKGNTNAKTKTKKTSSKNASKARKPTTSKAQTTTDKATNTPNKKKRRTTGATTNEDESNSSTAPTARGASRGGRGRVSSHATIDEEDAEASSSAMDVDDDAPNDATNLSDVYRAPFVDQVQEDGTWWCAKCSSDDPWSSLCELCGCTSGALFPKFILDKAGKPRILSRRRPFQPLHPPEQSDADTATSSSAPGAEDGEQDPNSKSGPPGTPSFNSPTPFWRPDTRRRRGRRPRASNARREVDIIWFHEICAHAKPRYYNNLIDPENVNEDDEDDEEAIPASEDEAEVYENALEAAKLAAATASAGTSSPAKSSAKSSSKGSANLSPSKSTKKRTSPPLSGDRNRTCRLCGSHSGACVKCSEDNCGRHFHAHCAEKHGLVVERDEPLRFKCRKHSFPQSLEQSHALDNFPVLTPLPPEEADALTSELTWHDNVVRQGKPLVFTYTPTGPAALQSMMAPAPAPATPAKHVSSSSSGGTGTMHMSVTKSFAMPRTPLLPLEGNMPSFVFNFWVLKRLAIGHELVHRLRALKQDETRKQEIYEALSSMEDSLHKMVLLRQHMERIRILVDLCKKREALKQQQLEELQQILSLPGLVEHAQNFTRPGNPVHNAVGSPPTTPQRKRAAPLNDSPSADGAPPTKVRKLDNHSFTHTPTASTPSHARPTPATPSSSRANGPTSTPAKSSTSATPSRGPRPTTPKHGAVVPKAVGAKATASPGPLKGGAGAKKVAAIAGAHLASPSAAKTPHRRVQHRVDVDVAEDGQGEKPTRAGRLGSPHLHPPRTTRRSSTNYANGENGFCTIS